MTDIVSVIIVATAWCIVHSLLITHACEGWVQRVFGRRAAWHRLVYNVFSTITLLWCWLEFRARPGEMIWAWHGAWQIPRLAGFALTAWIGWLGVRAHDNGTFLGLQQLRDMRTGRRPEATRLTHAGILGVVRHPYYTAGLIALVVYDDFTTTSVAWRGVFMLYLLVGAWLEERKLTKVFGDAYREYRREVPAFVPRPKRH